MLSVIVPNYPELTYLSGDFNLSIGDVVIVPIRKQILVGVVVGFVKETVDFQVKKVLDVMPQFKLSKSILDFITKASEDSLIKRDILLKLVLGPLNKRHKILIKKVVQEKHFIGNDDIVLSHEQQVVLDNILNSGVFVLDGVTGSGKTELYLQKAKEVATKGGQVLILLPEILLTSQVLERAKKFFSVNCWHSQVKQKEKDLVWLGIQNGSSKVVIGARSALFLPFSNLKLIIVDEEHDSSFKQDSSPTYNARDLAILMAKILNIPILLVSATPSIETMYKVKSNQYRYFHLNDKYNKGAKTEIKILNMWNSYDKTTKSCPILHSTSLELLKSTFERGKQSIVFLNRKGYAGSMICKSCMEPVKCINCNVKLTYYKYKERMKCRHCGYMIKSIISCKSCGKNELFSYQPGVEKLQEEIVSFIPNVRVLSVTRDSEECPQDIISKISNHECDIVVGTQMLAKGLHFPNMSLAVIVDGNNSKFSNDIRSVEKTYQIIQQVIGRVGREDNGIALIQTFNPKLPMLQAIVSCNKDEFIKLELESRMKAKVPPYTSFILINFSCKNEKKLDDWLKSIDIPESNSELKIFGPFPAIINKLNNKYRQQILFRGVHNIQKVVDSWLQSLRMPQTIQIKVDVDPINFY